MILGRAIAAITVVLAALALGMYVGGHPANLPGFLKDAFVDENASLNSEAVDVIKDNFYRKVPEPQLQNASLQGMVRSLRSRFSHYFTPAQNKLFEQATNGEFSGIGMTVVGRKRGLLVVGVFKASPAKRAGIRPGDLITKVNGHSIAGESSDVVDRTDQGQAGYVRAAHDQAARRAGPHAAREAGAHQGAGRELVGFTGRAAASSGVVDLSSFTSGAHARHGVRSPKAASRAAPTDSSSTCGQTAAACSTRPCWSRACSSRMERS